MMTERISPRSGSATPRRKDNTKLHTFSDATSLFDDVGAVDIIGERGGGGNIATASVGARTMTIALLLFSAACGGHAFASAGRPAARVHGRHRPTIPRGGDGGGATTTTTTTTTTTSLPASSRKDGVASAHPRPPASADGVAGGTRLRQHRYWRIARELGRHVWPAVPPSQASVAASEVADNEASREARKAAIGVRTRVVASVCLMLAGKAVTISTPFLFKMLVDVVGGKDLGRDLNVANSALLLADSPVRLPVLLLLAYGLCRSSSSLLREYTNVVFSHVAQSAIRNFGRSTFDHVHALDLRYHLDRNTGALSRVLERGSRSISFALNAMVFNTLPTLVEVTVVSVLMMRRFGALHAATVLATIIAYCAYTIRITTWRSQMRKDMISSENAAAGRVSDSLLNYETVKYFNNESHEGAVYERTLGEYQGLALKAASSLSALNFGQNAIFSIGLTVVMYLTLRDVAIGRATVGDLVLVNGLLFQLSVPLNFIGWVYQEVRQAFVDMEAMFQLRDTKSGVVDAPDAAVYDPGRYGTTVEFAGVEFGYETTSTSVGKETVTAAAAAADDVRSSQPSTTTTSRPILRKTTFTIPQGKTIAIVGR
jgi:ABC-type multidrug transport system fused ATPase/permease subunit